MITKQTGIVAAAILAAVLAVRARADSVTICNDAGDTCIMHKTTPAGSFENPIQDNYPGEYRPGYLHAGMYCAAGNWHHGWLMPWERAPVIKRSCGRKWTYPNESETEPMPFEQKDNSGALFKNDDKTTGAQPNARGRAKINGVDFFVAAWTRESASGRY